MTRLVCLIVAGTLLITCAGDAPADCRAVAVSHHQQAVVAYQPLVAQPYLWQVGGELRTAASEERIANLVIEKLQARQQAAPQTLPLTAEVDRWSLVKANCAACHSTNAKAMEAVDMTDLASLDCETKLRMAAAALDGRMPPKKQLDPSTLGNLLGEIVGAETVKH